MPRVLPTSRFHRGMGFCRSLCAPHGLLMLLSVALLSTTSSARESLRVAPQLRNNAMIYMI